MLSKVWLAQLPACSAKLRLVNFQRRCPPEMPHGDFLSLSCRVSCLVPAKGCVHCHCRLIDTCSQLPFCHSIDSGFSSPQVRFEPTCMSVPADSRGGIASSS